MTPSTIRRLASFTLALAASSAIAQLQGLPEATPTDLAVAPVERIEGRLVTMATIDADALARSEATHQRPGRPLRFAIPSPVHLTPDRHGRASVLPTGRIEWTLDIEAPGAKSVNLGTAITGVPGGVSIYLIDADGAMVGDPYDSADAVDGQLWTHLVAGGFLQLVVESPADLWPSVVDGFSVTSINVGYLDILNADDPLDMLNPEDASGFALRSAACHVDVACPEADPYPSQVSSVTRLVIGGSGLCSGVLVNNVRADQTPYVLTAHHCSAWANPASVVFYWNYEHSTCRTPGSSASGAAGNGSLGQNRSGSILRMTNPDADLTLVQMNTAPDPAWNVDFAGFDASGGGGAAGPFTIHHPNGEEKRISIDNNIIIKSFASLPGQPSIRVWRAQHDIGGIQGGSSGGPLYSAAGRVIGVNTGVDTLTACFPQITVSGRLDYAWTTAGTSGGTLSSWLDPDATGTSIVDPLFGNIEPPGPFALTTPADGATVVPLEPTLAWAASDGADEYVVTIDDDMDLEVLPLAEVTVTGTSWAVPAGTLDQDTTYYWTVTSRSVFGETLGSPALSSFSTLIDCDGNTVHDPTEIAMGLAEDCNMNGVIDSCDVAPPSVAEQSPELAPIGGGSPQDHTFLDMPDAASDVTLTFDAVADISHTTERFAVFMNASPIGDVFEETAGYFDCIIPGQDTIVVDATTWNASVALGNGDILISINPDTPVNTNQCSPASTSYVSVRVDYEPLSGSSAQDANMNGIPDECEGCVADITADGVCVPGMGDGNVNLSDFACYLSEWAAETALADITADGVCVPGVGNGDVNLTDFSCYLSEWAAGCP